MTLRQSIELHCEGNPFTVESPLKSLVSSALVPDKAKEDILCYAEKGKSLKTDCCHLLSTPYGTL